MNEDLRAMKAFAKAETERANRNGKYASNIEVALMDARAEIKKLHDALRPYLQDDPWCRCGECICCRARALLSEDG